MSLAWKGLPPPDLPPPDILGWFRVLLRAVPILVVLVAGFVALLLLRLPERLIYGAARPLTPWITQGVCIVVCALLGLRRAVEGRPMPHPGAFVANHGSWLDILVLNASMRLYFVAKDDVARWPGIGWLARGTGTLFIRRNRAEAAAQTRIFEDRLRDGHRLLFFPEGTSTDGRRVLPFKSTLFAAFQSERLREHVHIQPVSVIYHAPPDTAASFYGWWGDMDLSPSVLAVLSVRRQGRVELIYHAPLAVAQAGGRKDLARAAEEAVRQGLHARVG